MPVRTGCIYTLSLRTITFRHCLASAPDTRVELTVADFWADGKRGRVKRCISLLGHATADLNVVPQRLHLNIPMVTALAFFRFGANFHFFDGVATIDLHLGHFAKYINTWR